MENMQNLESILEECGGFVDIPVNPKAQPMSDEEIKRLVESRKERLVASKPRAEKVEPAPEFLAGFAEHKATLKLVSRVVAGGAVGAGALLAQSAGLMDMRLAMPIGVVALAFVAFWAGAAAQYHFGGLLE